MPVLVRLSVEDFRPQVLWTHNQFNELVAVHTQETHAYNTSFAHAIANDLLDVCTLLEANGYVCSEFERNDHSLFTKNVPALGYVRSIEVRIWTKYTMPIDEYPIGDKSAKDILYLLHV
jgi:hypothetical protein